MAPTAGNLGKVMFDAATVAYINEWEANITKPTEKVTAYADIAVRRLQTGLKDCTGSFKGYWDMSDSNGQLALQNALDNGTSVALKLYVGSTTRYEVTAFVTNIRVSSQVEKIVEVEFEFEADNGATYQSS